MRLMSRNVPFWDGLVAKSRYYDHFRPNAFCYRELSNPGLARLAPPELGVAKQLPVQHLSNSYVCVLGALPIAVLAGRKKRGKLRGVIYTRYSTKFQHSTDDQVRACQRWADANGIEVREEHILSDEAMSGRKNRRAGLNTMMALLQNDEVDVVITFATNRIHRKMHAALNFVQTYIVEKSKRCVFVNQNLDTQKTQFWKMLLQVFAMLDEFQVTMMAGNIREAHVGLLLQQLVHGTITFGYQGLSIEGGRPTRQGKARRQLAIDPIAADWVVQMFGWFVNDGLDFHDIAKRLIIEGAPPPPKTGQWDWKPVKRVLRNARYTGDWSYGVFESQWISKGDYVAQVKREAPFQSHRIEDLRIIDEELFEKAQDIIDRKANRGGRKRTTVGGETLIEPLKGMLWCPVHNVALRSYGTAANWWTCHACKAIGSEKALFSVPPRELTLRKVCEAVLIKIRAQPDLVEQTVQAATFAIAQMQRPDTAQIESTKAELDKVKHQLSVALRHLDLGDDESLLNELTERKKVLVVELRRLEAAMVAPPVPPTLEIVRAKFDKMEELLAVDSKDPTVRRELRALLQQICGPRIEVYQAGEREHGRGWLVAKVPIQLAGGIADLEAKPPEVVEVALRDPYASELAADEVMALWEGGMRLKPIEIKLGRSSCFVRAALTAAYAKRGEPLPKLTGPGTPKRATNLNAIYRVKAPEALALYQANLTLAAISERLDLDRNTLDKALKYEASRLGIELPDGRERRKSLKKAS